MLEESGMGPEEIEQMMNVGESAAEVTSEQMLTMGLVLIIPALIGLALAGLLVYLMAYLNKRHFILKGMFTRKTEKQKEAMAADRVKIMNVFLWIAIGFCVAYAVLTEILLRLP